MWSLRPSARFERRLTRFARRHPDLRGRVAGILRDLEHDPFQPHLRLHKLSGDMEGLHAVSITYQYRVTLTLRITEHEIILIDIGSHDEVYR